MQNDDVKIENEAEEEKVEDWKTKAEEYLASWQRERADFANYKKEESKRLEEFVKFANVGLVLEVVGIADDLEMAAKHEHGNGLSQIVKKFQELLGKHGVEKIKTDGKFNPELHEAVALETDAAKTRKEMSGELEEIRSGYTMFGKVIRPARVRIIK